MTQQLDSFTSQPLSPVPSASSSDVLQPPAKRKKSRGDEVDDVILCSLKSLQERRRGKEQQQSDEEGHFGKLQPHLHLDKGHLPSSKLSKWFLTLYIR